MEPPPEELFIKACKMAVNVSLRVFFFLAPFPAFMLCVRGEEEEEEEQEGL